ncbi:cytochrome P450 [Zopfochytrium polystomum]|nr:cytochrome P450 [Zopfochytrium polystomum]
MPQTPPAAILVPSLAAAVGAAIAIATGTRLPSLATIGTAIAISAVSYSFYNAIKYTILPTEWIVGKKIKRYPNNRPVLGNLLAIVSNLHRYHDMNNDAFKESDEESLLITRPFHPPAITTIDPALIEYVLKTEFESFEKGPFYRKNLHDILGDGIFNTDGEKWKEQRKLAANIFTIQNFKEIIENTFAEKILVLVSVFDAAVESKEKVNLYDLFLRFTMDGFCKIAFGTEINSLTAKERPAFAIAFDRIERVGMKRFLLPFAKVMEHLTTEGRQFLRDVQLIHNFSRSIVDQRLALAKNPHPAADLPQRDLLALMINATSSTSTNKEATHDVQRRRTLADGLYNFLTAGRDSTGITLSWIFLMLARHPTVLSRLLAEIDAATAGLSLTDTVSYETVRNRVPFATAVMRETLRLYPALPSNGKQASRDMVLPNGMRVRRGMRIVWSTYAQGRSTRLWGPDAGEFRPERWLEMDKVPSQFVYTAFNAGPRVCLGKSFAELEIVFVVMELLRRFRFEVEDREADGGPKTYTMSSMLAMKDGALMASVERR